MSEITLSLLHPTQGTPVQRWTFRDASVVRIGRAPDNDVVIADRQVSRHHAELRRSGAAWEVFGLGSNGTFVEGRPRQQARLSEGQRISLASPGLTLRFQTGCAPEDPAQTTTLWGTSLGLDIEIDENQRARQVLDIVGTDYFQRLQEKAAEMRKRK